MGTEPREGLCLTPHRRTCLSPQIPMKKKIKGTTAVSPMAPHCWHLSSPGGSAGFPLDNTLPPPSTVAPDPSPYTRGHSIRRSTPRPRQLLIFPLGRRRQQHLWFYFRDAPSSSVMSLHKKGADPKAPASEPAFLFGAAFLSSADTPSPAGFRLIIVPGLLIWNRDVLTTRQRWQSTLNICLTLSNTKLKMVGGRRSP